MEKFEIKQLAVDNELLTVGFVHVWFKHESVNIIPLGDVHLGTATSKFDRFERFLETLSENTYVVLLGDILDFALRDSFGDVYGAVKSPQESRKAFRRILEQYSHKILGVVDGNHEERLYQRVGSRPVEEWCEQFEIPYAPDILVLDIAVGENANRGSKRRTNYVIVLYHGTTAARTIGGKINGNARIIEVIPTADFYITGHVHQPSVVPLARIDIDRYNKKLRISNYFLITIPAWLGYESYAAKKAYQPSAFGTIKITLDGKAKRTVTSLYFEL